MTKTRNPGPRRSEVKRLLAAQQSLTVEELCEILGASPATIRRDLAAMQADGELERTYGGAYLQVVRPAEQDFAQRELVDVEEKRSIAEQCVQLIAPRSTIFINDGSTAMAFARAVIASGLELFIVTNAVNVASKLSEAPNVTTMLLGGFIHSMSLAATGHFTEHMISQINADFAIIAPDGVDKRGGITFEDATSAGIAGRMSDQSDRTIVLATARKVGVRERIKAIPIEKVWRTITGPEADIDDLTLAGAVVIHAGKES